MITCEDYSSWFNIILTLHILDWSIVWILTSKKYWLVNEGNLPSKGKEREN